MASKLPAQWSLELKTLRINLLDHQRRLQTLGNQIIPSASTLVRSKEQEYEAGQLSVIEVYLSKIDRAHFELTLINTYLSFALDYARWRSLTQRPMITKSTKDELEQRKRHDH